MKNLITVLAIIFLSAAITKAQITITASDFEAQLAIGKTVTTYNDRSTTTVNLGSTGSSTWDFSSLVITDEFVTESKNIGSSPYVSDFPGAEYASNYEGTFEGVFSNTWVYNSIGDNYVSHGTGTVTNTQAGPATAKITFEPAQVEYKLPVGYQSTWSYNGQQTIATTITLPFIGDQTTTIVQQKTRNFTVDGYGLITLPGGKTLNALRIREEITLTGSGVNSSSVMYRFLTKTGESINVTLADGVTANSGTVNISAVSWTTGDGTGVVVVTVNAPTSLAATAASDKIELSWVDNADNEDGYNIERAEGSGSFSQIAQISANTTSYSDATAQAGVQYQYRVQAYNGSTTSGFSNVVNAEIAATGVGEINNVIPDSYNLSQNYPNPFNPSTQIQFSIPSQEFVSLKVFNALGKEVAELVNRNLAAGNYSVDFNASKLSSGIYFYTITTNKFSSTKKMILIK